MTNDPRDTHSSASDDSVIEPTEETVGRYIDDLTAGRPVDPMQVLVDNPGTLLNPHAVLDQTVEFRLSFPIASSFVPLPQMLIKVPSE